MPDSILLIGDQVLTPSEEFKKRLHDFDPDLVVSWSHTRRRFLIEQCIEHLSGCAEHSNLCRKSYVWLVQDEDKTMMPLGDRVLEHLKKMRQNTENFGGPTERGLRNFIQYSNSVDQDLKAKAEQDMREIQRLNSRDNKSQINKLYSMIRHFNLQLNK